MKLAAILIASIAAVAWAVLALALYGPVTITIDWPRL